jgi:hypothetical protein
VPGEESAVVAYPLADQETAGVAEEQEDDRVTSTLDEPTPNKDPDVPTLDDHSAGVADNASQTNPESEHEEIPDDEVYHPDYMIPSV